ncbi:hypothetical protein ADUPG1_008210 [Aduncisulcus paluster]|uniref:Uncharacterized protein n=1 Tax=Aduncisulcus paluster TaxID=2918883 RepID=A0ABQ5KSG3_9EUKA|nr:hypothetical protein ADUPG1_008210 [Aduncisulcus paluster]
MEVHQKDRRERERRRKQRHIDKINRRAEMRRAQRMKAADSKILQPTTVASHPPPSSSMFSAKSAGLGPSPSNLHSALPPGSGSVTVTKKHTRSVSIENKEYIMSFDSDPAVQFSVSDDSTHPSRKTRESSRSHRGSSATRDGKRPIKNALTDKSRRSRDLDQYPSEQYPSTIPAALQRMAQLERLNEERLEKEKMLGKKQLAQQGEGPSPTQVGGLAVMSPTSPSPSLLVLHSDEYLFRLDFPMDYAAGLSSRIFRTHLSPAFSGMLVSDVCAKLFVELGVMVLGIDGRIQTKEEQEASRLLSSHQEELFLPRSEEPDSVLVTFSPTSPHDNITLAPNPNAILLPYTPVFVLSREWTHAALVRTYLSAGSASDTVRSDFSASTVDLRRSIDIPRIGYSSLPILDDPIWAPSNINPEQGGEPPERQDNGGAGAANLPVNMVQQGDKQIAEEEEEERRFQPHVEQPRIPGIKRTSTEAEEAYLDKRSTHTLGVVEGAGSSHKYRLTREQRREQMKELEQMIKDPMAVDPTIARGGPGEEYGIIQHHSRKDRKMLEDRKPHKRREEVEVESQHKEFPRETREISTKDVVRPPFPAPSSEYITPQVASVNPPNISNRVVESTSHFCSPQSSDQELHVKGKDMQRHDIVDGHSIVDGSIEQYGKLDKNGEEDDGCPSIVSPLSDHEKITVDAFHRSSVRKEWGEREQEWEEEMGVQQHSPRSTHLSQSPSQLSPRTESEQSSHKDRTTGTTQQPSKAKQPIDRVSQTQRGEKEGTVSKRSITDQALHGQTIVPSKKTIQADGAKDEAKAPLLMDGKQSFKNDKPIHMDSDVDKSNDNPEMSRSPSRSISPSSLSSSTSTIVTPPTNLAPTLTSPAHPTLPLIIFYGDLQSFILFLKFRTDKKYTKSRYVLFTTFTDLNLSSIEKQFPFIPVSIFLGSPFSLADWIRAGLIHAAAVVILPHLSTVDDDQEAAVVYRVVKDNAPDFTRIVVTLVTKTSARVLDYDIHSEQICGVNNTGCSIICRQLLNKSSQYSYLFTPSYLSGSVIIRSELYALIAALFYNPCTFIQCLVEGNARLGSVTVESNSIYMYEVRKLLDLGKYPLGVYVCRGGVKHPIVHPSYRTHLNRGDSIIVLEWI